MEDYEKPRMEILEISNTVTTATCSPVGAGGSCADNETSLNPEF